MRKLKLYFRKTADFVFCLKNDNHTETFDIHSDDPMEMIWAVREKIYEETKDMTREEWLERLRQTSEKFRREKEQYRAEKLCSTVPQDT